MNDYDMYVVGARNPAEFLALLSAKCDGRQIEEIHYSHSQGVLGLSYSALVVLRSFESERG